MKRMNLSIVLTLGVSLVGAITQVQAQAPNGRGPAPFVVGQNVWPDQAAFIASGGRCLTRDVGPAEAAAVQLAHNEAKRALKGFISGGRPNAVSDQALAQALRDKAGEIPRLYPHH
jgi:hypothetical protein